MQKGTGVDILTFSCESTTKVQKTDKHHVPNLWNLFNFSSKPLLREWHNLHLAQHFENLEYVKKMSSVMKLPYQL